MINQPDVQDCNATSKVSRTSESLAGRKSQSRAASFHFEWAERAWTAIIRSLDRFPTPLVPGEDEHKVFVSRYAKRSEDGTAMKWLKFHTSYIFAYAMNQEELPVVPWPLEEPERAGRPVGGAVGRALADVLARGRAGCWAYKRVAYDLLMSKLGFPSAPEEFVAGSMKDHRQALSKEEPHVTWTTFTVHEEACRANPVLSGVLDKIDEICDALFKDQTFHHADPIPSMRACFERGLMHGGGLGELMSWWSLTQQQFPLVEPDRLFGMAWDAKDGEREFRFTDVSYEVCSFQDFVDDVWLGRISDRLCAEPCPILEPLKVRIITKGQAAEYYRALELQKLMHSVMRKHPVFEFIGHPIDDCSFASAFGSQSDLAADEFYVSGDYKAATDNLNPHLSEYAWRAIASRVHYKSEAGETLADTPYLLLGLKALTGHLLHYTAEESKDWEHIIDQSWGQLMGSPMSFPILCLVNAAATLSATKQKFSADLNLRVNGDDIGFIANATVYENWKAVTKACGLEFSLGKNYTSREFLIMNSELRRAPASGDQLEVVPLGYLEDSGTSHGWVPVYHHYYRPKTWKLEGFLNQSVLYHTIRKGTHASEQKDVYWTDLADLSAEALRGIPSKFQWGVLSTFLEAHRPVLSELPRHCNLWLPRSLGGAGVAIPAGKDPKDLVQKGRSSEIVASQLKQAAYLACNPVTRVKAVVSPRQTEGVVAEFFKDVRMRTDHQVLTKLSKSVQMFPGQRPQLGGPTLLGLLCRQLAHEFPHQLDGLVKANSILGNDELEVYEANAHASKAAYLNLQYENWTRKCLKHSLTPIKVEHAIDFVETYRSVSFLELIHEHPSTRVMDLQPRCAYNRMQGRDSGVDRLQVVDPNPSWSLKSPY